jgi:hypothetical protein
MCPDNESDACVQNAIISIFSDGSNPEFVRRLKVLLRIVVMELFDGWAEVSDRYCVPS